MKLDQVLQALGITCELGRNFDMIVRGPNVWPLIIDRDTAIKALQYGCEKGPPFIVVRTIRSAWKEKNGVEHPREIWYKIGSTSHDQNLGFDLPAGFSGFSSHICIQAALAEALIAEDVLWIRGDVDEGETHCYYTGPGSYYEKNRAELVPYVNECIARRRREILTNHVRAWIRESVVLDTQELLDNVKKGYRERELLLPTDEAILAEINQALGAAPCPLSDLKIGQQFVHSKCSYEIKALDGNYYQVGPIGRHGVECRLPLDTLVTPLK